MWTVDYEQDIESDLSAFHRIDDPMTIDGPRYFRLAIRLTAYAGVMAARAEKMRQDERDGGTAPQSGRPAAVPNAAAFAQSEGWVGHEVESEG